MHASGGGQAMHQSALLTHSTVEPHAQVLLLPLAGCSISPSRSPLRFSSMLALQ